MADISSLGIGSGVLTADVIDQLKEADSSRIITPLTNKITINNQKQDATELLTSLMKTFKASASALSLDTIFDHKSVETDGKASVSIEDGANIESFTLETVSLAKKDITQFGSFTSKYENISSGSGVFKINDYEIPYDENTTLSDLAQSITDIAGDDVEASILQTGDEAFSLILTSKSEGVESALSFSDTDDGSSGSGTMLNQMKPYSFSDDGDDTNDNLLGYQNIQSASDAEFKYNGITITRSTNEVNDLVVGVNITLKEEGDISSISITQDTENLTAEMQQFTDSYNTLIQNLHDMTVKDEETGAEGVFNADTFVKSIQSQINKTITSIHENQSLVNFGIDIDRYGSMSFDKSVLEEKLADDPDAVKLYFSGGVDENDNDKTGIFEIINDKLNSYTGYGKLLSNFESSVKEDGENLSDSYTRAQASLDTRYEIMTKRFTAYDAMISSINSQFSSLQMMIDSESN